MSVSQRPGDRARGLVYIAYWGLCEPLGQALVMPVIKRLAEQSVRVLLVTFEKPADLVGPGIAETRLAVEGLGVSWQALRYHKRPQIPAKAFDVLLGTLAVLRRARRLPIDIIHGRTYMGGLIGLLLKRLLRKPFVFHNEGFWPDQQVEAGVWNEGGRAHRSAKRLEQVLYEHADGLILLSETSRLLVERLPGVRRRQTPTVIVPSCVDLKRFRPPRASSPKRPRSLVYLGSLGGRYLIEPLGHTLKSLREREPRATLTIASQSDAAMIRDRLEQIAIPNDAFRILRVPHSEVPALLGEADAGLFFLRGGPGALSCSPTKVGEYWACGLPVVANAGLGDLDQEIERRGVGVLVRGWQESDYSSAIDRLEELLADPESRDRCRRAAEDIYGLEAAMARQLALYRTVQERRSLGR